MDLSSSLVIAIVSLMFISMIIYDQIRRRKLKEAHKAHLEELRRQQESDNLKNYNFYKTRLESIQSVFHSFCANFIDKDEYQSHGKSIAWLKSANKIFAEIKDVPYKGINLPIDDEKMIESFRFFLNNIEYHREQENLAFIEKSLESYNSFFDNRFKNSFDLQQRKAIITDEDNNLIIAGAGSGKTTTIVGKVNYLIERYKIKPEEILLISFTKKSSMSLSSMIKIDGITVDTFHKFGKDVIQAVEGKPSIFPNTQFHPFIRKAFNELMHNPEYLKSITGYFLNYLKPYKSQFEFPDQGQYIQYLKDQNFRAYKQIKLTMDGKLTVRMEIVKSIEECKIANFLFFNNVDYEYEDPYEFSQANQDYRKYKPDFTILHNGKKIYLEHFGIARNGDVPSWFSGDDHRTATQKYHSEMDWKRNTHKQYGTKLIETFSYEMSEGILFDNLTQNLNEIGLILKPKSPAEIWQNILEAANDEIESIITQFGTFITLMKSNNYSITDVIYRNDQLPDLSSRFRNLKFIELLKPVYESYQNYLTNKNEIDFSDMINKATQYITNGLYQKKLRYIIVDEFQDISIGRFNLLKAIRNQNSDCKLYCVGDDWQSIYRFAGSDIALFKEFEKYFGFTAKSKIETTYRFFDPLLTLSSEFILKNPNQVAKNLKSKTNGKSTNYKIVYSKSDNQDVTKSIIEIFEELISMKRDLSSKTIFLLGRYSFDIEKIAGNQNTRVFVRDYDENTVTKVKTVKREYDYLTGKWKYLEKEERIFVQYFTIKDDIKYYIESEFQTVHKAKGLEADIVLIINCNSGKFGFPSEMSDDPILNLLLTESDQFENGEERRLFYVAMTRAKENVYFIADWIYKSKFIIEIELKSDHDHSLKCPECKTSDLMLKKSGISKNNDKYNFYGCNNYLYGCDYTVTKWEKIHNLYSVPRTKQALVEEADDF